jgi:serine protease inhibitor
MNKHMLKGFDEIRADEHLIEKTKIRMLKSLQNRRMAFPVKKIAFTAIPVLMVIVILAVVFINSLSGSGFVMTANAQDLMQGIKPQNVDVSNSVTDNFVKSTQNFSINLFKQTYKNGENTLISPTSAFLALGMTANGADGSTLKEFTNVLGKYGMTVDDLNRAYKAYSNDLTGKRGSTTINNANSIWFRTGLKVKKSFLQDNADFFGAGARALNFDDKNSADTMNNWVKTNTNGKIEKMVDELKPDDVMYLINALYFDAKWQKPFDTKIKASNETFFLGNGNTTQSTFMHLKDNLDYMKDQSSSAVLLPYDDGRFAMLCILPNKGIKLNDYISTMSENTIPNLIKQKSNVNISVTLPEFKVTADYQLNDMFKGMGLKNAFDSGKADFSKMYEGSNGLYISSVRQKTFLQINELGTQAGAATSVEMERSIIMDANSINFNRPFVYAIIDTQTNLSLFLGTIENPNQ